MKEKKKLNIKGTVLDRYQLEQYLEKIASDHILTEKSAKDTYPIPRLKENFFVIKEIYKLLNEQIKQGIPIHPAGEWILDNLYVIEEIVKNISKELTLKKYTDFLGLANGRFKGFARVYVLATEMVAYTDGKINSENLEYMLQAYQTKKTLSMNEIWNIGLFIQIALIENIREICETIYMSQMQKSRVEEIICKYFREEKKKSRTVILPKIMLIENGQVKNAFIEYMSYRLKKMGSKAYAYLNILEDEVAKTGSDIYEVVKKEHFDIAVKKVSVGNCILTLKAISRINFLEIFEKINRVEDILKQDPAKQYEKMDSTTKSYYRNAIQEISKKTKISEIYIAKKCLELSLQASEKPEANEKSMHIGFYLISDGKETLLNSLLEKKITLKSNEEKAKIYIETVWGVSLLLTLILSINFYYMFWYKSFGDVARNLIGNIPILVKVLLSIILALVSILPIENIVSKILQYVLSKVIKPKLIPKIDFQNGIPENCSTMVVIPTIVKSKEKVKELMKKLEVYYIANKSKNLYFTLLGDCSSGNKEIEEFDEEVIREGIEQSKSLNEKYGNIFNFVYRKRIWNSNEECYMGWERKRGLLNQLNEYLLGNITNPFRANTIDISQILI